MEIDKLLRKNRDQILEIARRYGVDNLRIFGSAARGEADADSDIDFLVRLKPGFTLIDQARLIRELEALIGRKVDVVSERGLRPRIKERVIKEARPL